jgi:pimeloyl-ACP methyl ester carboxylesterase
MKDKLIIIHGWDKAGSDSFFETVKFLKDDFDIFLIDLPGFKEKLERPYSFDDYLNYLEAQIDIILMRTYADFTRTNADKNSLPGFVPNTLPRYKPDKSGNYPGNSFGRHPDKNIESLRESASFYLLGHSFGGALSMLYALKHPEKIKKLILYNAAIIRRKKIKRLISLFIAKIFKLLTKIIPEKFLYFPKKTYYKFIIKSYDYLKADENLKKTLANIVSKDLTNFAQNLKVKTILLWGKYDKITPLKNGLILKNLIPDSELVIFNGGHSFHKENPEEFAKILKQIIKDTNEQ